MRPCAAQSCGRQDPRLSVQRRFLVEMSCCADISGDGVPDHHDFCPGQKEAVPVAVPPCRARRALGIASVRKASILGSFACKEGGGRQSRNGLGNALAHPFGC